MELQFHASKQNLQKWINIHSTTRTVVQDLINISVSCVSANEMEPLILNQVDLVIFISAIGFANNLEVFTSIFFIWNPGLIWYM